jgi:hypothetical protein
MKEIDETNYPSIFELEYADQTITTTPFFSLGQALDSVARKDHPLAARFAWNYYGTDNWDSVIWTNCFQSAIDEAVREGQRHEQRQSYA